MSEFLNFITGESDVGKSCYEKVARIIVNFQVGKVRFSDLSYDTPELTGEINELFEIISRVKNALDTFDRNSLNELSSELQYPKLFEYIEELFITCGRVEKELFGEICTEMRNRLIDINLACINQEKFELIQLRLSAQLLYRKIQNELENMEQILRSVSNGNHIAVNANDINHKCEKIQQIQCKIHHSFRNIELPLGNAEAYKSIKSILNNNIFKTFFEKYLNTIRKFSEASLIESIGQAYPPDLFEFVNEDGELFFSKKILKERALFQKIRSPEGQQYSRLVNLFQSVRIELINPRNSFEVPVAPSYYEIMALVGLLVIQYEYNKKEDRVDIRPHLDELVKFSRGYRDDFIKNANRFQSFPPVFLFASVDNLRLFVAAIIFIKNAHEIALSAAVISKLVCLYRGKFEDNNKSNSKALRLGHIVRFNEIREDVTVDFEQKEELREKINMIVRWLGRQQDGNQGENFSSAPSRGVTQEDYSATMFHLWGQLFADTVIKTVSSLCKQSLDLAVGTLLRAYSETGCSESAPWTILSPLQIDGVLAAISCAEGLEEFGHWRNQYIQN